MRIAIYGGTFDPIHTAHLNVAAEAAATFHLDRVLFIPAANPPHKTGPSTPYPHRLRMVELACGTDPRFEASRLEESEAKSYSYYTIRKVRDQLAADDALYFLIGADAFAEIDSWHRSAEVTAMVEFIVVTRPGHQYRVPPGAVVHRLETLALPVSSSAIRELLAKEEDVPELPGQVLEYVRRNGLYNSRSVPDGATEDRSESLPRRSTTGSG